MVLFIIGFLLFEFFGVKDKGFCGFDSQLVHFWLEVVF